MTTAMLAVGKAEAEKQRLCNIDFVQGDAEQLPFSDNSFDIVISRLAFHHFSNPKRCFSEMTRVVKTGGKLVVIDMEATEEPLRNTEDEIETLRDPSHMRNLSKDEFTEMFRRASFDNYDNGLYGTSCFVIRLACSYQYTCGNIRRYIEAT